MSQAIHPSSLITPPSPLPSIERAVCETFRVTPAQLHGRARWQPLAWARQVAMFLACEQGLSLAATGRWLGRDRATVLHGCRQVTGLVGVGDAAALADLARVRARLK
jgi:chromosomal replication initiator protein